MNLPNDSDTLKFKMVFLRQRSIHLSLSLLHCHHYISKAHVIVRHEES